MEVRSLALRTGLAIQRALGSVEDRGGYAVLRTPAVPDYWYGNCLCMPGAPREGDYERWLSLFEAELPGHGHRVFLWDGIDGEPGATEPFLAAGFELTVHDVLTAREPLRPAGLSDEFPCRRFSGDADWAAGVELSKKVNADSPGMTGGYIERTFAAVRRAVEAGAGEWWGAWDGERAIAQMGLFREGALARFKDVETHPDYRRRGACRSLLYRVCETAAGGSAQLELVIVPADDAVRRVYEAVGFRYREKVADLCRMPPG